MLNDKRVKELDEERRSIPRGVSSTCLGQAFDVNKKEHKSSLAGAKLSDPFVFDPEEATMAHSASQITRASTTMKTFTQSEGAVRKHPFKTFYTTSDPVYFDSKNTFEGRSNYNAYHGSGEPTEQKLETMWFHARNKELADKRRDEEMKNFIKQWANSRGRFEAEV